MLPPQVGKTQLRGFAAERKRKNAGIVDIIGMHAEVV
jgi:hypothetical protein